MKRRYLFRIIKINLVLMAILLLLKYAFPPSIKTIYDYIFEVNDSNFKEMLSLLITVLSILLSMVITIATLLLSMCDKRIMKLLKKFKKLDTVIWAIKVSILSSITSILISSVMYLKLDFTNKYLRIGLIWLLINSIYFFIKDSSVLVFLINQLLNETFYEENYSNVEKSYIKENNNLEK